MYNFILLFLFTALPFKWDQGSGVDTFILDSYRIQEGRHAIFELLGTKESPLAESDLLEQEETIEENDCIELLSDHEKLSELALEVIDGNLAIPSLGTIAVKHLTLLEAKEKILSFFPKAPKLELSFREKALHSIRLLGAVEKKEIKISSNTRLLDVLLEAHLSEEADLFRSEVKRNNHALPVDFVRLLHHNDAGQNIILQPDDAIIIPLAQNEITLIFQDSLLSFPAPNGFLSLKQLLLQAKIPIHDVREIQIIRNQILYPKIYTLNWRDLIYLPETSLYLIQGDQVNLIKKSKIQSFLDKL